MRRVLLTGILLSIYTAFRQGIDEGLFMFFITIMILSALCFIHHCLMDLNKRMMEEEIQEEEEFYKRYPHKREVLEGYNYYYTLN